MSHVPDSRGHPGVPDDECVTGQDPPSAPLHRRRRGLWLAGRAAVAVLAVPPIALGSAAITVLPAPSGSGAYVGAAQTSLIASFSGWRGRSTDFATDYLATDDWSKIEYPTWWLQRWSTTSTPLVLGVPMLVNDPATTLQRGAAGEYDGHFRQLARTLVQYGYGNAALRVGWEMNGDWYRWSATTDPDAWFAYYRRIVLAMRSVAGQSFRFDWNVNLGSSAMPATRAYPGDAYVDYVGIDVYDWKWGAPLATPAERWDWITSQQYGLDWVSAFATAHRKQLTVPEWGLAQKAQMHNGGGGDDPLFVRNLLAWTKGEGVKYESYFDTDSHSISNGQFPNAASAQHDAIAG